MIRETFNATSTAMMGYDGQPFTVVRKVTEPEANYDAEALPMYEVRFSDGRQHSAFVDEVEEDEVR